MSTRRLPTRAALASPRASPSLGVAGVAGVAGGLYSEIFHAPLAVAAVVAAAPPAPPPRRPHVSGAIGAATQELLMIRRETKAIGMEGSSSHTAPGDTLAELMAQISIAHRERDAAHLERDAARNERDDALAASARAEAKHTAETNELMDVSRRGAVQASKALRLSKVEKGPFGTKQRQRGGPKDPFTTRIEPETAPSTMPATTPATMPATMPATYVAHATSRRVYLDDTGRVGWCLWTGLDETLSIRIEDPRMTAASRPAFLLYVGGITSEPGARFTTETVSVTPKGATVGGSTAAVTVVSAPDGRAVYRIDPTHWQRGPGADEWRVELNLLIKTDSGPLKGTPERLELGLQPADAATVAQFVEMRDARDVQVKFNTENPAVGADSISVRKVIYAPPEIKKRIAGGDRALIGYNTDGIFKSMQAKDAARGLASEPHRRAPPPSGGTSATGPSSADVAM